MFGDADAAVDSMGDAHSDVEEEEEESIMKEERESDDRGRKEGSFLPLPPSIHPSTPPSVVSPCHAPPLAPLPTASTGKGHCQACILARVFRRR